MLWPRHRNTIFYIFQTHAHTYTAFSHARRSRYRPRTSLEPPFRQVIAVLDREMAPASNNTQFPQLKDREMALGLASNDGAARHRH